MEPLREVSDTALELGVQDHDIGPQAVSPERQSLANMEEGAPWLLHEDPAPAA